jgi:hypothetical protein
LLMPRHSFWAHQHYVGGYFFNTLETWATVTVQ